MDLWNDSAERHRLEMNVCSTTQKASSAAKDGLWSDRLIFTALTKVLLIICVGIVTSTLNTPAFGSCGHYVFTKSEWASHESQFDSGPMSRNSVAEIFRSVLGSPINNHPCDGPQCGREEFPANVSIQTTASRDSEPREMRTTDVVGLKCENPILSMTPEWSFIDQACFERIDRPPQTLPAIRTV